MEAQRAINRAFAVLRNPTSTSAEIDFAFNVLVLADAIEPCDICGYWHPKSFEGDCRDDENRF